jgi:hypothetical protein
MCNVLKYFSVLLPYHKNIEFWVLNVQYMSEHAGG